MSRRFDVEKFIKDVLNDKYALVIGNEIILDKRVEPSGDVHKYFLNKVNELTGAQYVHYHDIALGKEESQNPVRELIAAGEIKNGDEDNDISMVSPQLISLLRTRLFTTVLTTTTDGFLENVMRKVWPKDGELRIVNIYDKESVDKFKNAIKSCRKGEIYNQPTLIYVFGKMHKENWSQSYVKTDADAITLIEKWIRMDVESDNEMLSFIKEKRLLALGCKYDNWYFRFFWYILTGEKDRRDFYGSGEVAFSLDTKEKSENMLQQFLDRLSICRIDDATSLIDMITKIFTEDSENAIFRQQIDKCRRRGGVFISYCSKDSLAACQLFYKLCENKYEVWLDNARLYGGDDYEKEIADAISSSKVVITLLSPHVAEDMMRGETNHYYNYEWRKAQQFKDKTIIPLAINGYDLRSNYHKEIYESIVNQHVSGLNDNSGDLGTNLMDSDGFQKLISSIDKHL